MWVTDKCYPSKRIIIPETQNNPISLGPTLFCFTKDVKTFSILALELLDTQPDLINLKITGADMEEVIAKSDKRVILNIKLLYFVRHFKQRDEMKLNSLI